MLGCLGGAYSDLGRHDEAIDHHTQALAIAREVGNLQMEADIQSNLAHAQRKARQEAVEELAAGIKRALHMDASGNARDAAAEFEGCLTQARALENRRVEGAVLCHLGTAYSDLGRHEEAIEHLTQALSIMREVGDRQGEGAALGNLGGAY
eukprot:COSAG04_NODE_8018_length_1034_cov_0.922995_2_plen_150_part_01